MKTKKTHYVTLRLKFTKAYTTKEALLFAKGSLNKTHHHIGGVRVRAVEDNGSFTVDRIIPLGDRP